ncbi:type II toxin-antitoxin system RelE/ParE family toxin [Chromatocurvus halotolerans]|uniref:type II toxin-antitoxin system RelE/ParE family toxin n=1 Tax=Chromatocurvus halotolerans TaxID=1132028 RepID=UPI000E3D6EA6
MVSCFSEENPRAAEAWLDNALSSVVRLDKFPMSGWVAPEIGVSRIREIIPGNHRVIYSMRRDIEILTVRSRWQPLTPSALEQNASQ